jgi:hypothetical protein
LCSASNYGLSGRDDPEYYAAVAKNTPVAAVAAGDVKIDDAGENMASSSTISSSEEAALLSKLPVPSTLAGFRLVIECCAACRPSMNAVMVVSW